MTVLVPRERTLSFLSFVVLVWGRWGGHTFLAIPLPFHLSWLYTRDRNIIAGRQSAGVTERYMHRIGT